MGFLTVPSGAIGGGLRIVTGVKAPVGIAGMTIRQNATADDAFLEITMPFAQTIGNTSRASIFIGSNSYLTWGSGSSVYNSLSLASNPSQSCLHAGSADNSYQRVYEFKDPANRFVRARFEGTAGTSGTPGSPNIVWEATMINPTLNAGNQLIEFVTGVHGRLGGLFGLGGSGVTPLNAAPLTQNNSYVFQGNSSGTVWTVQPGTFVSGL